MNKSASRPWLGAICLALLTTACGPLPRLGQPSLPAEAAAVSGVDRVIVTADGAKLALHHRPARGGAHASVLLLPPYSMGGAAAFEVAGYSWGERLAADGFEVWALDYRGFGRSAGARLLPASSDRVAPAQRVEDSLVDALAAIDAIRARQPGQPVHLLGWGYGGLIAGMAAARARDKIGRLVLVGTAFAFRIGAEGASLAKAPLEVRGRLDPNLPPYLSADWESSTWTEWRLMMKGQALAEPAAVEAARAAFQRSDYLEPGKPPRLRRPTGPLVDRYRVFSNQDLLVATHIRAETLVVRGDLDLYAEPGLAKKLKGAARVEELVVANASHWLPYERERERLFARVSAFLKP